MDKNEDDIVLINLRVKKKLRDQFKEYCDKNGYSVSKRLRLLIENEMKK